MNAHDRRDSDARRYPDGYVDPLTHPYSRVLRFGWIQDGAFRMSDPQLSPASWMLYHPKTDRAVELTVNRR